ncbi:MAG TPA: hypothetical protein VFR58_03785 [Flavisolibacter sp.]|nr:hypothetical protein [Flavisolibacter sp.]
MSWDIVLLNSRQKITSLEELDDTQLEPTDFCSAFESHFAEIAGDGDHREIRGEDFIVDYFLDDGKVSNKMVSLYGEKGLFALVELAKKHGWQVFDTGHGKMIDLENPACNGYESFQSYLQYIKKK